MLGGRGRGGEVQPPGNMIVITQLKEFTAFQAVSVLTFQRKEKQCSSVAQQTRLGGAQTG